MIKEQRQADKVGDDKMKSAYKLANSLLRDRLKTEGKENLEMLDNMEKSDIVVVTGTYDHIHLVLDFLRIPFINIDHNQVLSYDFNPEQTVFVNCASGFPVDGARKLAGFVSKGGQLITTDWALKYVLEVGFPGYAKYNEKPTSDEVVRIEVLDKDDPVINGFLDEKADPVWWLEGSSYPIKILNKDKVKVLIRSKELGERYEDDPVIISFEHGEGIVYHMISHFYLQRTETREAKHKAKASEYASMKGASAETMAEWEKAEEIEDISYGTVQSAGTSAEFVSRIILKQKKKYKK